ncbi:60S ribosomal protein L18 [Spraguea lophii 42_110]|uniref:60S ribosomal protein L18 n=1 Tax=Spraguea lophii (strain 42_110) TaxID=1358809 RepID=S7WAI2_SPRLO|nr:Chain LQ0, 60S ribosomal protein L18 [Spraguea lophii 42_110]7QJH_KQ0 Chain KQ0, 60S ribosomal protein L18 [Spraguea lophii 42_110]7QJH_LQ0 Chain LQ0, 60S ribosomal protein L18 [Spraguea lophii 42_110]8BR3_LQ0 Chain LQ0, 60S ribosomal protein L18 [Spraguea lophii 42_110]8P5D_LQ0 Chain LQ0, 60S ribosomal protein L18 [Spraguea lophii 42_110]8P60_KQ0 Chain KQ0, 60S ribosomal protein L18 [Spraguea lophii 42_110]8P60_LQ0 Chain LQ0, 60S ribosomal protein L18 [Spraguea lophii 42_110]EPR78747.1 6
MLKQKMFEHYKKKAILFDESRVPRTKNVFYQSLFSLYKKVCENTENEIVHKITKRLTMSRTERHPLKLSNIIEQANGKEIVVFVGKVLDDDKILEIPKITIVALKISKQAKEKLTLNGGEFYTLDKLFYISKDLKDVALVKGDKNNRKCTRYFGASGDKGSETYPRTRKGARRGERRIKNKKK